MICSACTLKKWAGLKSAPAKCQPSKGTPIPAWGCCPPNKKPLITVNTQVNKRPCTTANS